MTKRIVTIGLGQLGVVFSEGFLRSGTSVTPLRRGDDIVQICKGEDPEGILVATGEDDLAPVLSAVPPEMRNRVILIQNELRPDQWLSHDCDPSVAIVWFEKKKGTLPKVVLPSVLFGKHAELLAAALDQVELPHRRVDDRAALAHELVLKNLYILGLNLTGMRTGGVASDLLDKHSALFSSVITEVLEVERALLKAAPPFDSVKLDEPRLWENLRGAIHADPEHGCSGRSAPRRLERTLEHAARVGVKTPTLSDLAGGKA